MPTTYGTLNYTTININSIRDDDNERRKNISKILQVPDDSLIIVISIPLDKKLLSKSVIVKIENCNKRSFIYVANDKTEDDYIIMKLGTIDASITLIEVNGILVTNNGQSVSYLCSNNTRKKNILPKLV